MVSTNILLRIDFQKKELSHDRYYAKGRTEEGDSVLSQLHDLPIEHENVREQKKEIMNSIELEEHEENKLSFTSLVWDKTELRVGRRIRIAFLILSFQQMMGW